MEASLTVTMNVTVAMSVTVTICVTVTMNVTVEFVESRFKTLRYYCQTQNN
jgi:hypothetical protein